MREKYILDNLEEKDYLDKYNIDKYDRPSVTTDIVAFKIRSQIGDTYRHNSKSNLSVLLIKRGEHPFKDMWALPGGFLRKGETIEECAYREIKEESGILPVSLMPVGVFSEPNRDPRGRIISNAYLSIISDESVLDAGTDAVDARWFDVSFVDTGDCYKLTLACDDIVLTTCLKKLKTVFKKTDFQLLDEGNLAFDHGRIIATAISILKDSSKDYDLIFDFLPEKFTLTALQDVMETIINVSLTPANFRRKIAEFVEETEEMVTGAGHRPAKLYKRK